MERIRIPSETATEYAKKVLINFKKGVIRYFQSFKDEENKSYFDYISNVKLESDSSIHAVLWVPGKKKDFEKVEIDFNCPLKAEIKFSGLVVSSVTVEIELSKYMIGPDFQLPRVIVKSPTYKPYIGYFGLAWEGLTGLKNKISFHPYENPDKINDEILKYSKDNIVDPLCDFLNNYKTKGNVLLKNSIAKFISDKENRQLWSYPSPYDKNVQNIIQVPINVAYNQMKKETEMSFSFYPITDSWVPLSLIVLNLFCPLSESTAYFNEEGELMSEDEIIELLAKIETERNRKTLIPKIPAKEKIEREENWDPFKAEKAIKRDEFGFMMDKRNAEFGTKDVNFARQQIIESQQSVFRQQQSKEQSIKPPEPQDVSQWSNESIWYNEMQNKKFTISGGQQNLNIVEKGEIGMLTACKPPFILRFARDQIRLNQNITGIEVQKLMFKYYRLGYLKQI